MLTIKEYAKNKGVTYEAIRKQLKTYEKELQNHIIKQGRTQLLDDYAVEFLDTKRASNTVIVERTSKDEEIDRLKEENKNLLIKIATLQEELLKEKDEVKQLLTEKTELLETKQTKQGSLFSKLFKK